MNTGYLKSYAHRGWSEFVFFPAVDLQVQTNPVVTIANSTRRRPTKTPSTAIVVEFEELQVLHLLIIVTPSDVDSDIDFSKGPVSVIHLLSLGVIVFSVALVV